MKDQNRVGNLRAQATENNVTEWILAKAKTVEETVEFDKLMAASLTNGTTSDLRRGLPHRPDRLERHHGQHAGCLFFFSVVRRRELFRSLRYNRQIPLFPQGE